MTSDAQLGLIYYIMFTFAYVCTVWVVSVEGKKLKRSTAARLTLCAPVWPLALLVWGAITMIRWSIED